MKHARGYAGQPCWHVALVFVACTLKGRFCSAFVLPGAPTFKSGRLGHALPSAAVATTTVVARGQQCGCGSDGQARVLSRGRSVGRHPVVSELCAGSVDVLDEEIVLAKFKRLQVKSVCLACFRNIMLYTRVVAQILRVLLLYEYVQQSVCSTVCIYAYPAQAYL